MRIHAVIGATFGDEGKGRTVDDLLFGKDPEDCIVVRHNSSAQAGHTVERKGIRHVFSHFGSGTFHGAPTYLGPKFVINPRVFSRELKELFDKGLRPEVLVHPGCIVSTPYDTAANQISEVARTLSARHGSCGIGFGATIERSIDRPDLTITVGELYDMANLEYKLERIAEYYRALMRCHREVECDAAGFLFDTDADLTPYYDDLRTFRHYTVRTSALNNLFGTRKIIIFEGAQGLLLDQDHEFFPHVTRCSTGLRDVAGMMQALGETQITAHYVMRPYLTRHGAGPLPFECTAAPVAKFSDLTNVHNAWQGDLRFGVFNFDLITTTIKSDLEVARRLGLTVTPGLTMTCVDQISYGIFDIVRDNAIRAPEYVPDVLTNIAQVVDADGVRMTHGSGSQPFKLP